MNTDVKTRFDTGPRWAADTSFTFNTYTEARTKFNSITADKKRIRARPSGKFDVIVYRPLTAG